MEEKLTEEERLRLNLQQERARRIQAELANIKIAERQLQQLQVQAQMEHQAFGDELKTKYSLKENDQIDSATGQIIRAASVPTPPPAEAPPVVAAAN